MDFDKELDRLRENIHRSIGQKCRWAQYHARIEADKTRFLLGLPLPQRNSCEQPNEGEK